MTFFFVFSFLYCLTLVQLYDMTTGLACRVGTAPGFVRICGVLQ